MKLFDFELMIQLMNQFQPVSDFFMNEYQHYKYKSQQKNKTKTLKVLNETKQYGYIFDILKGELENQTITKYGG